MPIQIQSAKDYTPQDSVVNSNVDKTQAADKVNPFTYTAWLERVQSVSSQTENMMTMYTEYLNRWSDLNRLNKIQTKNLMFNRYKQLLRNIALNYTTPEEKRFLSNIDYDNIRHVESAIPFFASKIKQISLHVALQRDIIKEQKATFSNLGSVDGLVKDVSNQVLVNFQDPGIKTNYEPSERELKFNVSVIELYDYSKKYHKSEQTYIDETSFLSQTEIIQNVLRECQPVLVLNSNVSLLLSNNTTLDQDIDNLNESEFFNYIKSPGNLNKLRQSSYIDKYLGSAVYTLSAGEVSKLTDADTPWANMLNRGKININSTQQTDDLRTTGQIGGFFKPQHMGLLTFYSHAPELKITDPEASQELLQDVTIHGNSVFNDTTTNPVDHVEDVTWIKADSSNPGLFGDIIDSDSLAKFTGYRSVEENNMFPRQGVSRSTDVFDFFTTDRQSRWANSDVFELKDQNRFDIDTRQETLRVGHDTMYQWRTDVFGNEFALYKPIRPVRGPQDRPPGFQEVFDVAVGCEVIDGGDTLAKRDSLYTPGVYYDIYDGGRSPGGDPKIEQFLIPRMFPDLRRIIGYTENNMPILEDWNTFYYGIDPLDGASELGIYPVTFHGFQNQMVYDRQAYGGLFTDITCGLIQASTYVCEIVDNYAFGLYTEQIPGTDMYESTDMPGLISNDAFESYLNPELENDMFDASIGFTQHGVSGDSDIVVITKPDVNGDLFESTFCEDQPGDFEHARDQYPTFRDVSTIAKTTFSPTPASSNLKTPTLYEQKTNVTGDVYFRSYNGANQTKLHDLLKGVMLIGDKFNNTRYLELRQQIEQGEVLNIDILYDNLLVETRTLLYVAKLNFDAKTSMLMPSNTTDILVKLSDDENSLHTGVGWFFNEQRNELVFGRTTTFTISPTGESQTRPTWENYETEWNDNDTKWEGFDIVYAANDVEHVYPVMYTVDLNTLQYRQAHPNRDYADENDTRFTLTDDLSALSYESVDRGVISYDHVTDEYNVSYSVSLSSADDRTVYAVVSNDYRRGQYNLQLTDNRTYHAGYVNRYDDPTPAWTETIDSKTIRLNPDESLIPTQDNPHVTRVESLSSMIGYMLSGMQFDLEIMNRTIPVSADGGKLNKIIFDPGDGGDTQIVTRSLNDGTRAPDFDISEIPDQSDLGDPRRHNFEHRYLLSGTENQVITSTVSAVYSDFTTLTYKINIETMPYTVDSGLGGVKMIDSRVYTEQGESKQMLVLETQRPRYVSTVVVDR